MRRDRQCACFDPHVGEGIARGAAGDLGEPAREQGAAFFEPAVRGVRHGNRQRARGAHALEQGGRDELILDRPPLPAALNADVAGAQPVAQRQQCRDFPGSPVGNLPGQHRTAPAGFEESDRQAAWPGLAVALVDVAEHLHGAQRAGRGRECTKAEGIQEGRPEPVQHRPSAGCKRGEVGFVRAHQPARFRHTAGEALPSDRGFHRFQRIAARRLGGEQGVTELGEYRRTLSLIARALRSTASALRPVTLNVTFTGFLFVMCLRSVPTRTYLMAAARPLPFPGLGLKASNVQLALPGASVN